MAKVLISEHHNYLPFHSFPSKMASNSFAYRVNCALQKPKPTPTSPFHSLTSLLSSTFKKPFLGELGLILERSQIVESLKIAPQRILDSIADTMFKYIDNPESDPAFGYIQGNFAPVDEIGEPVSVYVTEGELPEDFHEGVYIRNGSNLQFPDQMVAHSPLGEVHFTWFEGEGMVHATYFDKDTEGRWHVKYKNKYIEAETFLAEKEKNGTLFLPSVEGRRPAVMATMILNMLRLGKASKDTSSTNVFEHAGRVFTVTENHVPYEIDISNLETKGAWDLEGAWCRPFTSHPKKAPGSGELVFFGVDVNKPYYVLGVLSADGKKIVHNADLKFKTATLIHEISVTEKYNVIFDYPLKFGIGRLFLDQAFIGYDPNGTSKIGVMPRYGDAESITWFSVKNHCTFHIFNTFEYEDEVIVRGCRASSSLVPGLDHKVGDKSKFFKRAYMKPPSKDSEGFDPLIDGIFFSRPYEWRLNMKTGVVKEGHITTPDVAMDFPTINDNFTGIKNKYAYAQVVDSERSANTGVPIFNMFAKLSFDEKETENEESIKVEYHVLGENQFCSGLHFVEKPGNGEEDDGWLMCYVHDETTNVSHVRIVDAKKFTEGPIAIIPMPQRVPYGFHGTFVHK